MCYNNCRYFRKDTETCRLPKGVPCPEDEDHWPAWPPTMEEYGAYCACRGCEHEDKDDDVCFHPTPRKDCPRKRQIMEEMYPEAPGHVCE